MVLIPNEEQLQADYIAWFKDQFGVPPVVTSSTGLPAVHFAAHVLKRFVAQLQQEEGLE